MLVQCLCRRLCCTKLLAVLQAGQTRWAMSLSSMSKLCTTPVSQDVGAVLVSEALLYEAACCVAGWTDPLGNVSEQHEQALYNPCKPGCWCSACVGGSVVRSCLLCCRLDRPAG